jgi:urea transporter
LLIITGWFFIITSEFAIALSWRETLSKIRSVIASASQSNLAYLSAVIFLKDGVFFFKEAIILFKDAVFSFKEGFFATCDAIIEIKDAVRSTQQAIPGCQQDSLSPK